MKKNLLIVGAGIYGLVAKEIADSMKCFRKIDFIDDSKITAPNGAKVVGKTDTIKALSSKYTYIIVAIGNPDVRLQLLDRIEEQTSYKVAKLVSPTAYVSPSAVIKEGCIIEPKAVLHSGSILEKGCLLSAGAVVNHASICKQGVHLDCNATVDGYTVVPEKTKVACGEIFSDINVHTLEVCFKSKS